MKARFLLLLALACAAPALLAQRDMSKVEIKVTPVAKNIYMLEGSGAIVGNIGVSVGPDGVLIVDDAYASLAEKIEAAVRQLNPGKLKFVLNTHFHGDHIGGNAVFAAKGATIIAQSNVRKRLASDSNTKREGVSTAFGAYRFNAKTPRRLVAEEICRRDCVIQLGVDR